MEISKCKKSCFIYCNLFYPSPLHNAVLMSNVKLVKRFSTVLSALKRSLDLLNRYGEVSRNLTTYNCEEFMGWTLIWGSYYHHILHCRPPCTWRWNKTSQISYQSCSTREQLRQWQQLMVTLHTILQWDWKTQIVWQYFWNTQPSLQNWTSSMI